MLRIGPSGNSLGFYESGRKHTYEEAEWLHEIGLTAFEYSFGRGVHITDETAAKIAQEMNKYDIALSIHAPYYEFCKSRFGNDRKIDRLCATVADCDEENGRRTRRISSGGMR